MKIAKHIELVILSILLVAACAWDASIAFAPAKAPVNEATVEAPAAAFTVDKQVSAEQKDKRA